MRLLLKARFRRWWHCLKGALKGHQMVTVTLISRRVEKEKVLLCSCGEFFGSTMGRHYGEKEIQHLMPKKWKSGRKTKTER